MPHLRPPTFPAATSAPEQAAPPHFMPSAFTAVGETAPQETLPAERQLHARPPVETQAEPAETTPALPRIPGYAGALLVSAATGTAGSPEDSGVPAVSGQPAETEKAPAAAEGGGGQPPGTVPPLGGAEAPGEPPEGVPPLDEAARARFDRVAQRVDALPEWELLRGENMATTPAAGEAAPDPEAELRRTRCSLNTFRYLYEGGQANYEALTREQPEEVRLTPQAFAEEHRAAQAAASDEDTLFAAQYEMVIHDVGKNPTLYERMGLQANEVDHDEVLRQLIHDEQHAALRQELLPSLDFSTPAGQLIKEITSIKLNYPQLLQGEAPPDPSQELPAGISPQAVKIFTLHAKLDIAGARGNIDETTSHTFTAPTQRRMQNLDAALNDQALRTAEERNHAFLDAEIKHFTGTLPEDPAQLAEARAIARLSCHKRVEDQGGYARLQSNFDALPETARAILSAELNRSHTTRATLTYYSPVLLRALENRLGEQEGLKYFAHVLQEGHIADKQARADGLTGVLTVQVGELAKAIANGDIDPTQTAIKFQPQAGGLVAVEKVLTLTEIDELPELTDTEQFRDKKILFVGEGGGSDVVQAKLLADMLARKYGAQPAAIVSIRDNKQGARELLDGGERIGQATQQVLPESRPADKWRYVEDVPLEGDHPLPTYLLGSAASDVVSTDIAALAQKYDVDMVVGVDTGGDSLFRTEHPGFSAHLATETTPDQDFTVIRGLADLAARNPALKIVSAVVAPGVDTPPYAKEVLHQIGATRLPISDQDADVITDSYRAWRMDGSGNAEERFGKTPLAFGHAVQRRYGLQLLPLPARHVTSSTNPWRAFTYISPAMRNIVLADMQAHFRAIDYRRPVSLVRE